MIVVTEAFIKRHSSVEARSGDITLRLKHSATPSYLGQLTGLTKYELLWWEKQGCMRKSGDHDDVIKWGGNPPVTGALIFSLMYVWTNGWTNNGVDGNLDAMMSMWRHWTHFSHYRSFRDVGNQSGQTFKTQQSSGRWNETTKRSCDVTLMSWR